ncbi:CBS domain-containing protein [Heliorestis acidaminivorans]|uniref:CBS domain-containing protein n=1 Tax=Heliorestis acidaminivorans TaxID=553427 RepID=A0A6I0F347_9FIRM|nr:CBS and ACT domain-containing protein [Heliorestis acidaminivorans]KAB2954160.1 CBS domain-containing protein [Heliorestis acidaminivorans]
MLIEEIMEKNVHFVGPESTALEALLITQEKRVRHIPVVEEGKVIGILSDRDLRDVKPSILSPEQDDLLATTKVKDIMRKPVITVHPLDAMEDAARIIYEHKIGCLPVVQNDRLVGIITSTDLLHSLVVVMGVAQPGSHVEIDVPDKPGALLDITRIIKEQGINIISIYVTPGKTENRRTIVLRVGAFDTRAIVDSIVEAGYNMIFPLPKRLYEEHRNE